MSRKSPEKYRPESGDFLTDTLGTVGLIAAAGLLGIGGLEMLKSPVLAKKFVGGTALVAAAMMARGAVRRR